MSEEYIGEFSELTGWTEKNLQGSRTLTSQKPYYTTDTPPAPPQVGLGLLALHQLNGVNGVLFYSSNIFKSASQFFSLIICKNAYQDHQII
ncbi:hypothetical protein K7X08_029717 [Anisodus acutangulus]|uniref:Uncharacterized protein n=1 Tax=Anisodus acutangulus TaxID=402998 RepID=A0A9Q1QW76_9SOLA|nr:hypothetical protein K7X08_029717 [Anisodus acutangulus]